MKGIGTTGASRGRVGVTRTGVEIGLDVGIGQLGISTDYGGGIVVGIGGQKIVWGREGGKIHYNVGGLEVIVEARDCVVVETKKIAGMVVARRTYPDPGCKLLPEPPKEPIPTPTPSSTGIDLPSTEEVGWVVFDMLDLYYVGIGLQYTLKTTRTISDIEKKNKTASSLPFKLVSKNNPGGAIDYTIPKNTSIHNFQTYYSAYNNPDRATAQASQPYPVNTYYWWYVAGFFGKVGEIKKFIEVVKKNNDANIASLPSKNTSVSGGFHTGGLNHYYFIPTAFIPLKDEIVFLPPPSTGNQPPMPESCCEALQADIEDIKNVLATKEILAGKLTFPWELRMPGGKGEEVIMDYPSLARAIAQMIDHLGIHPPKLSIKDINNAVAGDQSLNNQFPSVTKGFEALMAQVWDANADVDTLTNILYRLSWLNVQQTMSMAKVSAKVECLVDMLGGETEPSETTITTPFNISAGIKNTEEPTTRGKGFGKNIKTQESNKINKKIDANTEIATESLLPDFLKVRENPISVERFSGGTDINDKLDMLIMMIESLRRGQQ